MNWKKCEEEYIKKVEVDNERIKSILRMCDLRLKEIKNMELNDNTAFMLAENYYEIINCFIIKKWIKIR